MLQLIIGRAGSGKSTYAVNLAGKFSSEGKEVIFFAPEQFSLETEKLIASSFPGVIGSRIEVLSFRRIPNRVFREYGGFGKSIDEAGHSLLVAHALMELADRLKLYKHAASGSNFITEIMNLDKELRAYVVSTDDLFAAAENLEEQNPIKDKISEVALIISAANALIEASGANPKDELTRLCDMLNDCNFFKDKAVILDAYRAFTPQEMSLISHMMRQTDVYITLCTDNLVETERGMGIFSMQKATAKTLYDTAKRNDAEITPPINLGESKRFKNEYVSHLEKNIFVIKPEEKVAETFFSPHDGVFLTEAPNITDEIEHMARSIRELVLKGLRYRDIVVAARTLEDYGSLIEAYFLKYKIPFFIDKTVELAHKPIVSTVLAAFEIVNTNWSYEAVFKYLKSGLLVSNHTGIEHEAVDECENYVKTWNIRGSSAWTREWLRNPKGYARDYSEADKDFLERVNTTREAVISPLIDFQNKISSQSDVLAFSTAVYELLVDLKAEKTLKSLSELFINTGRKDLSDEYNQLWDILMQALDQMVMCVKTPVTPLKYAELLENVLSYYEIGRIPSYLDAVLIGSADRIRTTEVKHIFVLGFNSGLFPLIEDEGGIFLDKDREILSQFGINLSPGGIQKTFDEKFYAYNILARASSGVHISWTSCDNDGSAIAPSYIIGLIKKIFPGIPVGISARVDEGSEGQLSSCLSEQKITPALSERLFGKDIHMTPTHVQKFTECKFSHFCHYGLKLKEKRKTEFTPDMAGTFMHYIMESVISEAMENNKSLPEYSPAELKSMTDSAADSYVKDYIGKLDDIPARFKYLLTKLKKTALKVIEHLCEESKVCRFTPADFELNIGKDVPPFELAMPDGGTVLVTGIADRVDKLERNGVNYIRVMDYKSGTQTFKLSDIYNGLDLQMLIYLFAIWQNGAPRYGNVLPAGVLYIPAKLPSLLAPRNTSPEELQNKIKKELKMSGLLLNDPEMLNAMENGLNGIFIPAKITKSGNLDSRSGVATLAEFGKLKGYVEKILLKMGSALHDGDVTIDPLSGLGRDSCKYCKSAVICGFDKTCRSERKYKKIKSSEFFNIIEP